MLNQIWLFALTPTVALAEVADKEPSLLANTMVSAVAIVVGLALVRFRWWLFPAAMILVIAAHYPILAELNDSFVGPAIRRELGAMYVWQPKILVVLGTLTCFVYAVIRRNLLKPGKLRA